MASTSGMVMPTTRPGRMSTYQPKRPPLCKPKDTKLTASTMKMASISTLTNSPTEVATARGWSCICTSCTPIGKDRSMSAMFFFRDSPRRMMSPPLVMETPSASTCSPW